MRRRPMMMTGWMMSTSLKAFQARAEQERRGGDQYEHREGRQRLRRSRRLRAPAQDQQRENDHQEQKIRGHAEAEIDEAVHQDRRNAAREPPAQERDLFERRLPLGALESRRSRLRAVLRQILIVPR